MENDKFEVDKMGFFAKLKGSLTNPDASKKFLRETMGRTVIYLLLLSLILGGISAARKTYNYNKGLLEVVNMVEGDMPDFTFENGQLSVQGNMPKVYEDEGQIVIIDTSGKTDESILDKYQTGIFISKDKMVQKQGIGSRQETSFAAMQGVSFTKENLKSLLGIAKFWPIFIIIFTPIFFFVSKFAAALITAVIALIINAIFIKANLGFGDIYKLAIYSLTLSMILKVFSIVIAVKIPYFGLLYYAIAAIYLCLGLNAIKKDQDLAMQ